MVLAVKGFHLVYSSRPYRSKHSLGVQKLIDNVQMQRIDISQNRTFITSRHIFSRCSNENQISVIDHVVLPRPQCFHVCSREKHDKAGCFMSCKNFCLKFR